MEFKDVVVPKNFNIFFFGDLHDGSLLFHEKGFKNALAMTKTNYMGSSCNRIIGMGDYIEAIDTSDRRFDVDSVRLDRIRPDNQREHFQEMIKPYKKKFDTALYGNHEDTLMKYHNYVGAVCQDLGIHYGTYTCILTYRLKSGKKLFKVYVAHGRGTIRSSADDPERVEANLNLSLKRKLKNKAGDCAVMAMGHTHLLLIAKPKKTLYMTSDGNGLIENYKTIDQNANYIHPDHRYYLNTGTFRKTYERGISDYAEKAMYDPVVLGFPVLIVRNGKIVDAVKEYV